MKALILSLACILSSALVAQTVLPDWAIGLSSADPISCNDVAVDPESNVVVVGSFINVVDFDPSGDEFLLEADNTQNIFVAKYSSNGDFMWARAFGGTGFDRANALAIDQLGRIHVTGSYDPPVNFATGTGSAIPEPRGGMDAFILSLDSDGNYLKVIGGGGDEDDSGTALATDDQNNIYATGIYQGNSNFSGPGQSFAAAFFPYGLKDVYMVKIGSDLLVDWDDQFGGVNSDDVATTIAVDSENNIIIGGNFSATCHFDPSSGNNQAQFQSLGFEDCFVTKRANNGEYIWAKVFGGGNRDGLNDLDTDDTDAIYSTGFFEVDVDFNPDPEEESILSTGSDSFGKRSFIQKLNGDGEFIWARQIQSATRNEGNALVVSPESDIFLSGFYFETADFDTGPSVFNLSSNEASSDVYVLNLNENGDFVQVDTFGGNLSDQGLGISLDSEGRVAVGGFFASSFTIFEDPPINLNGQGLQNGFVVHYAPCSPSLAQQTVTSCGPYTWIDGFTYTSSTSNPVYVVPGAAINGCDSIYSLDLTVNGAEPINLNVTIGANEALIAEADGLSYQWLDCDDDLSIIPGEINQSFNPSAPGNYAVQLSNGLCTDTTECVFSNVVGIYESSSKPSYSIYPNPGKGEFRIEGNNQQAIEFIRIYDASGRLIAEPIFSRNNSMVFCNDLYRGIYLIELRTAGGSYYLRYCRE